MSLVRYTNKRTGVVTVYESTSFYDPVRRQSRPKRKYLGVEDPLTHEIIPTSGRRGRRPKKDAENEPKSDNLQEDYQRLLTDSVRKDELIQKLENENASLRAQIRKLTRAIQSIERTISPFGKTPTV